MKRQPVSGTTSPRTEILAATGAETGRSAQTLKDTSLHGPALWHNTHAPRDIPPDGSRRLRPFSLRSSSSWQKQLKPRRLYQTPRVFIWHGEQLFPPQVRYRSPRDTKRCCPVPDQTPPACIRHASALGKRRAQRGKGQCGDHQRNCDFHGSVLSHAFPSYADPALFRRARLTLFKSSGIYRPWTG
jgi:hypothetical protein